MADAAQVDVDEAPPPKKGKKGLLIGLVAMLLLGGGGFFATFSGMLSLPFGGGEDGAHAEAPKEDAQGPEDPDPVFVAIDPMTVTLGPTARARHLRISVQLEVVPGAEEEVAKLMPRIK
ncbi:MAG: flagellar basal body protein FliL, partial [Pseudomonadota bacterium]|nr:flagellar basal body protein FliL [Pseudomonadota bacterium]